MKALENERVSNINLVMPGKLLYACLNDGASTECQALGKVCGHPDETGKACFFDLGQRRVHFLVLFLKRMRSLGGAR
jgi:hypothetical protein